jgi:hypothetical protein
MQSRSIKSLKLILFFLIFPGLVGINIMPVQADGAVPNCDEIAPGPNNASNALIPQFSLRCNDCLSTMAVSSSPNDECRNRMTQASQCVTDLPGIDVNNAANISATLQTQIVNCYDKAEYGYNFAANCAAAGRTDCAAKETQYNSCITSASFAASSITSCYATVGVPITIETECPNGAWRSSAACGGNCATKLVMNLFNALNCDGQARWLYEDAARNRPDLTNPADIIRECGVPTAGQTPSAIFINCSTGCQLGQWACSFGGNTTCAGGETQALFNSTWVDGQARWKREAAFLLGDVSGDACGGTPSVRFVNDTPPQDCTTFVSSNANGASATIQDVAVGYCSTNCPQYMNTVVDRNTRCNNLTLALLGCLNNNPANIERCTARVDLAADVYGTCERAQIANCDLKQNSAINCFEQLSTSTTIAEARSRCYQSFVDIEIDRPRGRCEVGEIYCSECDLCVSSSEISCEIGCRSEPLRIYQYEDQIPEFAQCVQDTGEEQLSRCLTNTGSTTPNSVDDVNCMKCLCSGNSWTGIGCISTSSTSGIVISIMRIVLGVMGGIFLLLMISAGYLYNTQNSENIELAKKRITAMLAALVFITFSVLLLRVIGVNILDVTTLGIIG